jgi:osmoprotectant transport system ATP-binding protein
VISLEHVSKFFGSGAPAVDDLSLDVAEGEVCVLIGPSGCGKTTTMKMINRLIEPDRGRILVNGTDVSAADPVRLRREIGYVIQQVGLFPHQTVAQNVGTVPRLLGWDRARTSNRVDELLAMVDLDPGSYGQRYPHQLSGGQAQRVGVARALAADPPVLLMDEPFGALDPLVRERLQAEFRRLQGELRKTVVFVTHDLDEAVRVGDRIAVLAVGGRLEQYAPADEVLAAPASPFVADFVGDERGLKWLAVSIVKADEAEFWPSVGASHDGADAQRALHRHGVDTLALLDDDGRLAGWVDGRGRRSDAGPVLRVGGSRREALSRMLLHGAERIAVVDDDDRFVGVLTGPGIVRMAAARAAAP